MKILEDIKGVITRPQEAFTEIEERKALFSSFLIYLITEGVIMILQLPLDKIEFITIIPLLISYPFFFFIYPGIIHLITRRYSLEGSYRGLLSVSGYTCIPSFLLWIGFPLLYPGKIILYILASFIFLIGLIWEIILIIMAIRVVYKITLKRVLVVLAIFFCLASILESIYVSFNETFFFQSYTGSKVVGGEKFEGFTKDKLTYYFRAPKEGELVIFVKEEDIKNIPVSICLSLVDMGAPLYSWIIGEKKEYMGKILGREKGKFLVLPEGKMQYEYLKNTQIKGRVCNVIRKELK